MSFKPTETLILEDQLNNSIYTLQVSAEDYQKAQTDLHFAEALLFHAQVTQPNKTPEPNEQEDGDKTRKEDTLKEIYVEESHEEYNDDVSHNSRRCWSYEETICLINSMEVHMEALQHPKKKKGVFEHIANDLCNSGFRVNAEQSQAKWKSLVRSYKICKDHKTKTGRGPSRFHFYEQIDLLLGSKPSNKCSHALESSDEIQIMVNTSDNTTTHKDGQVSSDAELTVEKTKRRRTNPEGVDLKTLVDIKKQEYKRREERHREKCALEEKKIELLSKILDKQ